MTLLAHIKILPKILGLILMLAAAACFGSWYAGQQMALIDSAYLHFLSQDARASSTAPRLTRSTVQFQALGYRIIAETDVAQKRKVVPEIDATAGEVLQFAGRIKSLVPRHAAALERVEQRARDATAALKTVVELALGDRNDKALELMGGRVNPLLDQMLVEVRAVRDQVDKDVERGADDLTGQSHAAVLTTHVIMGGATLLAIAAALSSAILASPSHCMR